MSVALEQENLPTITVVSAAEAAPATRFYRAVWRLHFYAGLFVIPFMLILAITGIIVLFKPQLNSVMYGSLMWVEPAGEALPYTQQLAAAKSAYPDAAASSFRPADTPDRSAEVGLTTADERNLTVFVNPYTGQVLGERNDDTSLQTYAETIHGDMLLGDFGDRVLELAASWGIVLAVTGLYLWWPRKGSLVWGTLLPRLNTKNQRLFWRDLHAVPGFWGALLVIFFMLTGLPWTGLWGDQFSKVWSQFPPQLWDDVPTSTVLTGSLNEGGSKVVPWAVEELPLPQSTSADHAQHQGEIAPAIAEGNAPGSVVNLDTVIALAQTRGATPGYSVSLPADETGVYTVAPPFPTDATQEVTLHIDQYSGEVLADVRWNDYGFVPKLVEAGVSLHMGGFFGLANQLLMLFGCLVVITLGITSIVMWWQRRPAMQLGAPPMPKNMPSLWKGFVAILLVTGFVFPLLGASLVAALALDFLVIRRIPVIKRALG
jgi:uncharacterized iron-regulated membrane protein